MQLLIRGNKDLVTSDFGEWLIPRMRSRIISRINKQRLSLWDKTLLDIMSCNSKVAENGFALLVVSSCTEKLVSFETSDGVVVTVDPELVINKLKLAQIAKTINFGTLTQKGYPLFTDCYEYFAKNIDTFFSMYNMSRGIYVY
jgi:hypothetical protein